ncbi:MAG: hypothetical protein WBA51_03510 [Erythrobacter sp.]
MSLSDKSEIRQLIGDQFAALNWSPDRDPVFTKFEQGFIDDAILIPARRPAKIQSIAAFLARMTRLRDEGTLTSFSETGSPALVQVFENVGIAVAGCEMLENGTNTSHDVSVFLFVKDRGQWKIAAQAWDATSESDIDSNLDPDEDWPGASAWDDRGAKGEV